jgi:hypothetical protein
LELMPSHRPIVDFRNGATEALTLIDQEGDVHQLHS